MNDNKAYRELKEAIDNKKSDFAGLLVFFIMLLGMLAFVKWMVP